MKAIFVDTSYWIAITYPTDSLYPMAHALATRYANTKLITSEMVLTEYLNGASSQGSYFRMRAAQFVANLLKSPRVEVASTTRSTFTAALSLYNSRADKEWSLTDCASINICNDFGIEQVLTHDHHFTQAGLVALMR